jgi:hypothetical protein
MTAGSSIVASSRIRPAQCLGQKLRPFALELLDLFNT